MGDHTEKILCPKCGAAVRVEAGLEFEQVHSHKAASKAGQQTATSSSGAQGKVRVRSKPSG